MTVSYDREIRTLRFMQGYGDDLLADIAPEDFCRQPVAKMNHPAWIIGHLAVAADHHAAEAGGTPQLVGWDRRFDFGTEPSADPADYPGKAELIDAWHAANDRYIAAVSTAAPQALAEPTRGPLAEALPTVGDFLTFSLTAHTSLHLGQLSAWRRAAGMPRLF
ncbi:MAG: DinB family protein [Planctomycetota bacterium]